MVKKTPSKTDQVEGRKHMVGVGKVKSDIAKNQKASLGDLLQGASNKVEKTKKAIVRTQMKLGSEADSKESNKLLKSLAKDLNTILSHTYEAASKLKKATQQATQENKSNRTFRR